MLNPDEIILEIKLDLMVEGEKETLEIPIPFDYDGQGILRLVMEDMLPYEPGIKLTNTPPAETPALLNAHDFAKATAPTAPDALDADVATCPTIPGIDSTVEIAGAMPSDTFEDWRARSRELQEIKWAENILDDTSLTPGIWPGIDDERTLEPTTIMLDETIDHDLHNAAVVQNDRKAAFRAMRETSGASQAALADALGVNARTVKRWETPGQPEPPQDAWNLVEAWRDDAVAGANWHIKQAEELRADYHEAYVLTLYRSQEEFDRVLSPILAQAPSYRWQDALTEARAEAITLRGDDSFLEIDRPYTNFPGTRSYWRSNAAARLAAILMDAAKIPYGFAYPDELPSIWDNESIWIPRADVQRIESASGTIITCGMR
ncbi:MAG: helix-turn-helix domain-containing protein [Eggerthellaceae bacterium]|nr:helix-turn-helix domain-containing protein [Eggerthellaceae bacterium]